MSEEKLSRNEVGSRKFGACPAMAKNFREAGQRENAALETLSNETTTQLDWLGRFHAFMIHSILVFIFSALGLAIWVRMTFTFAPGDTERLHSVWMSLSLFGQCWLAFSFVIPAAYYLFTLLSSVSVVPQRALKKTGITMHLLALPVFIALYTKFPTVSRSALLTAFFWFMMYRERASLTTPSNKLIETDNLPKTRT